MQVASPVAYSPSRKHEARQAVRRLRNSPNIRDVIREQCRNRLKERREAGFIHGRRIVEVNRIKDVLSEEFEKDLELQELVYAEMMTEFDNWVEEEMRYFTELEDDVVVCPLCQKNPVVQKQDSSCMSCACGSIFDGRPEDLAREIHTATESHTNCRQIVNFFSDRPKSLHIMCYDCDFFFTIRP